MRCTIVILAIALCIAIARSHPLPEEERLRSEALDRLVMVEADNETALRSKRTIGILRELFPEFSQMIEQKVNSIVAEFLRVLGPVVLRNFLGNGQAGGSSSNNAAGTTVTVASPFGSDEDNDSQTTSRSGVNVGSRVSISLPTFPPDEETDQPTTTENSSTMTTMMTTTITSSEMTMSSTEGKDGTTMTSNDIPTSSDDVANA